MKNMYFLVVLAFLAACSSDKKEQKKDAPAPKEVKMGEKVAHSPHTSFVFYEKSPNAYNLQAGDYITMRYSLLTEKGDTISSSYRQNLLIDRLVDTVSAAGSIESILMLVAPNDSLSIFVNAAKHYQVTNQVLDSTISPNSELRYDFKVLGIKTAQQKAQEMRIRQEAELAQYVEKNKLKAQKHLDGLYVIEDQAGIGTPATTGDSVIFTYKTYDLDKTQLLDGTHRITVGFILGKQTVIPAWEIALRNYVKENGTYTLLMPSHLCFGGFRREVTNYETNESFMISPFTILRTEMVLRKIIRAKDLKK